MAIREKCKQNPKIFWQTSHSDKHCKRMSKNNWWCILAAMPFGYTLAPGHLVHVGPTWGQGPSAKIHIAYMVVFDDGSKEVLPTHLGAWTSLLDVYMWRQQCQLTTCECCNVFRAKNARTQCNSYHIWQSVPTPQDVLVVKAGQRKLVG